MNSSNTNNTEDENRKLVRENEELKKQLYKYRKANKESFERNKWIIKKSARVVLGSNLHNSVTNIINEVADGKIKKESIANVIVDSFYRLTRIGLIGLFLALMPAIFTFWQAWLIRIQNDKIEFQSKQFVLQNDYLKLQNDRITKQNYLVEAQRRSSYIFLLGNIMEEVNRELEKKDNVNRNLSSQLQGQIIALSHSLKPYKFLVDENTLSELNSPERAQLFIFLLESDLSSRSYEKILNDGDFSYMLFEDEIRIYGKKLNNLEFNNSTFTNFEINKSRLERIVFRNCEFNKLNFEYSIIKELDISTDNKINKIETHFSNMTNLNLGSWADETLGKIDTLNIFASTINDWTTHNINSVYARNSKFNKSLFFNLKSIELQDCYIYEYEETVTSPKHLIIANDNLKMDIRETTVVYSKSDGTSDSGGNAEAFWWRKMEPSYIKEFPFDNSREAIFLGFDLYYQDTILLIEELKYDHKKMLEDLK